MPVAFDEPVAGTSAFLPLAHRQLEMTARVVPTVALDNVPVSGLPALQAHLQQLVADAALPLDVKLLDHVELQLTEDNIPPLLPTLLPPLTQILKSTTQDPTPALSLTVKLLSPLSFTSTLAIADPPSLLTALRSTLPGANLLALAVIHKAAKAPSDAAILSTLPDVVEELVRCWLDTPDVGVGERAAKVLGDVLETDCEVVHGQGVTGVGSVNDVNGTEIVRRRLPGHARLWRLIFLRRPGLALIQSRCTPQAAADRPCRSMHAITISQGRLLRMLPRLAALDVRAVNQTAFPDLFPLPGAAVQDAGCGLLQWATLGMVDKSDVLMHLTLVDFFETLVSILRVSGRSPEQDHTVKSLLKAAVPDDAELETALRTLPDRTVEVEAEALRKYIAEMLL
ncbi:Uncharacterized protein TCAP_06540 [Tolypocladium capitatum]|uniref:DNA mismatch repair protein HSM3 N-terminal domain-containing protein n=1 Tax=Tolypocladium capitatum TaxID=45235 RepID=A0A2K3Q7I3_9HYPO|nr:Uncharacterized protein TCAP_06540 [Tolypocladium capitatum]